MQNNVKQNMGDVVNKDDLNEGTSQTIDLQQINQQRIFTIGGDDTSVSDGGPPLSPRADSEVTIRPKIDWLQRRVVSTSASPSVYLQPSRPHSSLDLQNYGSPKGKKKNDKMVLKLVLPRNNTPCPSPNFESSNYLSVTSLDDYLGSGQSRERPKQQMLSVNQDFNGGQFNRGYSGSDLKEYHNTLVPSPGMFSTVSTDILQKEDNPTSPELKKKAFTDILVKTFSLFYALFVVTVGLAAYITDIIDGTNPTAEIFSVIIVAISFAYITFLVIDISIFSHKKRKYEKQMETHLNDNSVNVTETPEGHFQFDIVLPKIPNRGKAFRHDYCFNRDKHTTNFYLKVGAAAFCFGHLIHSGLLLGYQLVFFTNNEKKFYECASLAVVILDIMYPCYSFILLFFIFKYSNVIINRKSILARFGIMHCLASSICFWLWTIMREVLEAIANKTKDSTSYTATSSPDSGDESEIESLALPMTAFTKRGADILTQSINLTLRRFTPVCDHEEASLATIYKDISPYLYPFSVEFSILVVGVLYLVWQNIKKCDKENEAEILQCDNPSGNADNEEGNVTVHADCQGSNKGLFGGFIILILSIVSSILFFITIYDDQAWEETGLTIVIVTLIFILCLMMLVSLLGYRQITKLDISNDHHNLLDDVLLFICIPAFFLNFVFSLVPAIINKSSLAIAALILEIIQVLLQTAFILDGVRRCSNTRKLRKLKPGRELVTFMTIANISLWLMQTFEVKSHGLQDHRYDFYGKELWTILGHMCLPLMMFYRFHSSVCFGDIWKFAYQPSDH